MTQSNPPPIPPNPVDPDTEKQAVLGHGVPSQDPDSSAQVGLSHEEAERESKSVLIGGGLVAGLATGAAVGAAALGPVGILVGGTIGGIAGAVSTNAVGKLIKPKETASTGD